MLLRRNSWSRVDRHNKHCAERVQQGSEVMQDTLQKCERSTVAAANPAEVVEGQPVGMARIGCAEQPSGCRFGAKRAPSAESCTHREENLARNVRCQRVESVRMNKEWKHHE